MKGNNSEEENSRKKRIIVYIIVIIILILLLITSCSSGFLGTIGNLFRNEGSFVIDDNNKDKNIILNKELKFDVESFEITTDDYKAKLSYSYKNIKPGEFTCSTSDAEIATCYVNEGSVILNPKKEGKVTVYVQTEANGKIYKASSEVTIKTGDRRIELKSTSGTINLANTNKKTITYTLVGISGDVSVSSSDDEVATAIVKDNAIQITGYKKGTAEITLTVKYNDKTYTVTYSLKVTNVKNTGNSVVTTKKVKTTKTTKKTSSENTTERPTDKPTQPVVNVAIDKITIGGKDYDKFNKDDLTGNVIKTQYNESSILLNAIPENNGSHVRYKLNGQTVEAQENGVILPLQSGDNKLEIVVEKDGKSSTYQINIHKPERTIQLTEESGNVIVFELGNKNYTLSYTVYDDYGNPEYETEIANDQYTTSIERYPGTAPTLGKGSITFVPEMDKLNQDLPVTIKCGDITMDTKIRFEIPKDIVLSMCSTNENCAIKPIDIELHKGQNNTEFNLYNKNFFKEAFEIDNDKNNGTILLTDDLKKQNVKVLIEYDPSYLELNIPNTNAEASINTKVTAKQEGSTRVHVTAVAYGNTINDFYLDFNIYNIHQLTLVAGDDAKVTFFKVGNERKKEIIETFETSTSVKLSNYDNAYMYSGNNDCSYYKIKGFSKTKNSSIVEFGLDTLYTLTEDTILYAVYDKSNTIIVLPNILYLDENLDDNKDAVLSLFENKAYADQYGKDKVIYPTASGSYIMNIKNDSSYDVTVTGINLEEKTVCIKDKGCLNMGYAIRDADDNYYLGSSGKYDILNKHSAQISNVNTNNIDLISKNQSFVINKNSEKRLLLLWKWVDSNSEAEGGLYAGKSDAEASKLADALDTAIGEQAAITEVLYNLSVSISYEAPDDACPIQ